MASPGPTLPGIVGVLTYMERSHMAHDTRVMFGQSRQGDDVDYGYKDAGAAQICKNLGEVRGQDHTNNEQTQSVDGII